MPIQATRLETEEDVKRALAHSEPVASAGKTRFKGGPAPADDAPPLFRPAYGPPRRSSRFAMTGRRRAKRSVCGRTHSSSAERKVTS